MYKVALLCVATATFAAASNSSDVPVAPYVNLGTAQAVEDLLDRRLPGAKEHFTLSIDTSGCAGNVAPPCFSISDGDGGTTMITATGASELASGVGYYMREYCNMVIGWKRGG